MFKTFVISYRLKITYRANSIIFALRQLPLIKKLIPQSLYASAGLKKFATVIAFLYEVLSAFIGKIAYLLLMIYAILNSYVDMTNASYSLLTFFFLTVMGAFANTGLLHATKDKYYAIFLMRLDASECVRSDYAYFLINRFISFYPAVLILGLLAKISLPICLLMPVFMVSVKLIWSALQLSLFTRKGKLYNEDSLPPVGWVAIVLFAAAGYVLPALGIGLPEYLFAGITIASVIAAVPSCLLIARFSAYKEVCRTLLLGSPLVTSTKETSKELAQETYRKKIEMTEVNISSKKTGYAYFHEIFVQRHRKLFEKPAKFTALILAAALLLLIVITFIQSDLKAGIHEVMTSYFTYSLLLMYFINRGSVATETMFRNCDQSMLHYSYFRQPKAVLALFWERLKTLVKLNMLPATVLAIGFPILLLISGGTTNLWEYAVIMVAVYGMSAFFSVHTLVIYYLLQPYNKELENKSIAFFAANMLTYIVCYGIAGKQMSTLLFGAVIIGFCVIYIPIALLLAYRLAPKTFHLR